MRIEMRYQHWENQDLKDQIETKSVVWVVFKPKTRERTSYRDYFKARDSMKPGDELRYCGVNRWGSYTFEIQSIPHHEVLRSYEDYYKDYDVRDFYELARGGN